MKILKILAWILFFPFMLTYWGFKNKKKPAWIIGLIMIAFFLVTASATDTSENNVQATEASSEVVEVEAAVEENREDSTVAEKDDKASENKSISESTEEVLVGASTETLPEGYTLIEVDGGDLSGHREPNVVVDIGFGDREYYAFTNEYGQLVEVVADEIILQDDDTEPVLSTGRYFRDEAKVPGVESKTLDEGHVIADSLGGVSNAYNITPQESTLNRHGDQAYMEKVIREANGCTDFTAIITYPNTETMIPSHYSFRYRLNGEIIKDEFDNVNPDVANEEINKVAEETIASEVESDDGIEVDVAVVKKVNDNEVQVSISKLDKKAEYIIIKNNGAIDVDLSGWRILSVLGGQEFYFSNGFVIASGDSVMVGGYDSESIVDLLWKDGRGVWNNSKSDSAELYNAVGELVDRMDN